MQIRTRRCFRSAHRRTVRKPYRSAVRICWRVPDDLAAALTAYRHAIRAHRRLAKLAPRFFDPVVVERERRWREDRRQWMDQWAPIIAKAYGTEPKPYDPTPDLPVEPTCPRTRRAVERELAGWEFWLSAAQVSMDRYQERRPHDLMSWSRMARLMQIAMDLRQLALGIDPDNPNQQPDNHDQSWADLKRSYGHLTNPAETKPPEHASTGNDKPSTLNEPRHTCPPASLEGEAPPKAELPAAAVPATVPVATPSQPPACSEYRRRDAYASLARHLRNAARRP
jgi:hypothetical protein